MLYDPKWGMSLDDFISWLESKPPETAYNWMSTGGCVFACYQREKTGQTQPTRLGEFMPGDEYFDRIQNYQKVGCGYLTLEGTQINQTYGQALKRARSLRAELVEG